MLPKVKFDLTSDEVLTQRPTLRPIGHHYSDQPLPVRGVASYPITELFGEKLRALAERCRPRDLYDVVHLHRHPDLVGRSCLQSDDLVAWPRDYRLGLAFGLWFSPEDHLTLTPQSLQDALTVLDPVPDAASELTEMVDRIAAARPPGGLTGQWGADYEAAELVRGRITVRPQDEADALRRLADVIDPGSF